MKVLFVTSDGQDNLEDATLHGLRTLLGSDCVDWPKTFLYRNFDAKPPEQCYGNLFTIWRTLEDIVIDRDDIDRRLAANEFDLVVLGSIHRVLPRAWPLWAELRRARTIALDGEDHAGLAAEGLRFLYFKRELCWKARLVRYGSGTARWWRLPVPTAPLRIEPLAFSIPAEKIVTAPPRAAARPQRFPRHVVDVELRDLISLQPRASAPTAATVAAERGYIHSGEDAYYSDLRRSLYGITTKRGGWDCLRHYEIAANGAIICFRDLDRKPRRCAPAGLDATNSLTYRTAPQLVKHLERLSGSEQDRLIEASHRWALGQTTERRAKHLLDVARRRLG